MNEDISEASLNVLYVDDEPDIRQITEISLRTVGKFSVQSCASGLEALNVNLKFTPDIILLDVMMPDMDGPTTMKKMREQERFQNIPVIFMTARVQKNEVEEYLNLGAIGVISKPFDPLELSNKIKALLD